MKATGKMIRLMATASTCMLMGLDTKVSGKKISSMAKVLSDGLMELFMMANTTKDKNMDAEHFSGATTLCSLESLKTTTSKVMELTNGTMGESIMAIGKTIKCMERESLHGLMAESTLARTKRT